MGSERVMLEGFLDYQRASLLLKCAGLTGVQLAARVAPPSELSLLWLVRHLAEVERTWFRRRFGGLDGLPPVHDAGEPDAARAAEDLAALVAEQEAARAAVSDLPLTHVFVSAKWGDMQLRWVYSHMTAEYARHCGHADLLRERIDGVTGH